MDVASNPTFELAKLFSSPCKLTHKYPQYLVLYYIRPVTICYNTPTPCDFAEDRWNISGQCECLVEYKKEHVTIMESLKTIRKRVSAFFLWLLRTFLVFQWSCTNYSQLQLKKSAAFPPQRRTHTILHQWACSPELSHELDGHWPRLQRKLRKARAWLFR